MYDKNSVFPFGALIGEFPSPIPRKKNPGDFFIWRQLRLTQREASFPKTTFVFSKPLQYQKGTNMARPKKEVDARKSRRISLRLTETEYEVNKEFVRRGRFTLSELIRLMKVNEKLG